MFDIFYLDKKPGIAAHEQRVSCLAQAQQQCRTRYFWLITYLADFESVDWLWEPPPWQSHQRHAWPSQWQKDCGIYLVPNTGYTDTNYHTTPVIPVVEVNDRWNDLSYDKFDYTWHPDSTDTPYIYQFGTQWQKTGGPRYTVPGATEVKYVDAVRVEKTSVDNCWEKIDNVDDTDFDYTWHPDSTDDPYIYQFGTQWQKTGGPRYTVPGATEVKYVDAVRVRKNVVDANWSVDDPADYTEFDYTWSPDSTDAPYIYQFGTQWQKTGGPRYAVPGATEVKYVSVPRATRIKIDTAWIMPDSGEFENFDYTWHPDSTDEPYIYQFGTQWQKTGGPRYVVPGATEVKYVEQVRIESRRIATQVFLLDHLDGNVARVKHQLEQVFESVQVVRYFDNYLDTLRRVAKTAQTVRGFVWVCSSVCDYANFDFSWHPEQWQTGMLHVFASDEQKFGDTFFMHPASFVYRSESCQLLDWYDVNYVKDIGLLRWPLPVIQHTHDTHVEAVRTLDWPGPLAVFTVDQLPTAVPAVSLWREKTKTIVPLSPGATSVVVPKTAVPVIKKQLYDYPHIDKTHTHVASDKPLDIVFISNGEVNAEQHWSWLTQIADTTAVPNSITHVSGINGRVAAYQAAAEASTTPWFFAVFAKLEIDAAFNWAWQPDRMQEPKHYVFHALNPVTGLEYGHQAMIAYNKKLVLENTATGLDFTLDQAHEVVPVLSGTAHYHHSAWMCWRTAFRECIKLRHSLPDVENEYRLQAWLDNNLVDSNYGEWSRRGAADAVEYYNSVDGQFSELRNSYDWTWLAKYARIKHGLTPDQ